MSEVVRALLVEIDGNTEKLRRALREGGMQLDGFAQKSTNASRTSSTAADMVASRQANAARSIAMATETIARQGAVSGEAAKQVIAQGANAAFAFGPQGALVGAIGISTLAIVSMFTRTRREMQETIDTALEAQNKFAEMDAVGQARAINTLYRGDRAVLGLDELVRRQPGMDRGETRDALRRRGLDRLKAEQETLESEIAGMDALIGGNRTLGYANRVKLLDAMREITADLTAEIESNTESLRENASAEAQRSITGLRREAGLAREKEAERGRRQAEERLVDSLDSTTERMQKVLRDGLEGTDEDVRRAFEEMAKHAREHGGLDIPFIERARDQALELNAAMRDSQALLDKLAGADLKERILAVSDRDRSAPGESQLAALETSRERFAAIAADQARSEKDRRAAMAEVLKLQAEIERRVASTRKEREKETDAIIAQAQAVGQAIDGVLQMAGAWGNVRREVIDTLRGVVQIGTNVPNVLDKFNDLQKARDGQLTNAKGEKVGAAAAAASLAGAVLPVLGALSTIASSVFGDSPAEQERKRVQRDNTRAIERLTKQMGLGLNISGSDFGDARGELLELMGGEMRAQSWTRLNGEALRRNGGVLGAEELIARGQKFALSDFADSARIDWSRFSGVDRDLLEQAAQELGITLDGTVGSFRRLMEAMDAAEGKLFEFGDSYAEAKTINDAIINAKGITDPVERFKAEMAPAAKVSPLVQQLLNGADLTTAEGRQQIREQILAILETMQAGGDALGGDQVGDLTRDEILTILNDFIGTLGALDGAAPGATSTLGGVSGFRGLSEAAGSRLGDYTRTLVQQGDAAATARATHLQLLQAQLTELTRLANTPFTVPAIPGVTVPATLSSSTGAMAPGAVVINLNFGDIVVSGPSGSGAAIGASVVDAIDDGRIEEVLYRVVARALKARGDVSIIPGVL